MNLCDIETIRAVLGRHGFHFSKSLGQNFLTDITVPERIAEMSGAREAGNVVEVGPGMGCLTAELCRRAEHVVSVELDRALLPVLAETMAEFDNFEVVQGDVLALDLAALCREIEREQGGRLREPAVLHHDPCDHRTHGERRVRAYHGHGAEGGRGTHLRRAGHIGVFRVLDLCTVPREGGDPVRRTGGLLRAAAEGGLGGAEAHAARAACGRDARRKAVLRAGPRCVQYAP